jgi:formylglycine-generating enzyme required for sulfatase activity
VLSACAAGGGLRLPPPSDPPDPDGEDDGEVAPGPALEALLLATGARFEPTSAPEGAWPRICDLRGFRGAVYTAHLRAALDQDGAQIHRYEPVAKRWSLAFDWDRGGGVGTHEVGGQGIARLRVIGGRLHATDADAPRMGGFGISGAPFEDYVFVSDAEGVFPPLGEGLSPPAGTRVVDHAFHVLDVIEFRGWLLVSGGTVPLDGRFSWRRGPYPGGIWIGPPEGGPMRRIGTVGGETEGVVRTTYLHRFRGRLYLGLQNNEQRVKDDLAVVGDLKHPTRIRLTPEGGWQTRRFASGGGTLYWIGGKRGRSVIYSSTDGERFTRLEVPSGEAQDIAVVGGAVYLLTTTGLFRRQGARFVRLAEAPPGDPFGGWDAFCSAPLDVAAGELWAGSATGGRLYRVVAEPPRAVELREASGARLMRTEVTNAQFSAFVAETGHVTDAERAGEGWVWRREWTRVADASWRAPHGPGSDLAGAGDRAVVQVSQRDAAAFCAHHGLRLPTDEEWTTAAGDRRYVWGDTPPERATIRQRGNVGTLACCAPDASDGALRVGEVARYAPSEGGFFDLAGNVWEWTSTPSTREPGRFIIRGGGWGNSAEALAVDVRHTNPPDIGLDMVGIRCAGWSGSSAGHP